MWGDLGKLIVAKGFKNCAKSNKLPNLVTLVVCKSLKRSNFLNPRKKDFHLNFNVAEEMKICQMFL